MGANPWFSEYFRNVFAADEAFFHTILGNSTFQPRIRRNIHFEDWSDEGSHPLKIEARHFPLLAGSGGVFVRDVFGNGEVLFARKFSDHDLQLMQQLDEIAQKNEAYTDHVP